jgi:hypothetical protein
MDITHIDEVSLTFLIYYRNQCKRNKLPIDIFYVEFDMNGLKLI